MKSNNRRQGERRERHFRITELLVLVLVASGLSAIAGGRVPLMWRFSWRCATA